MPQLAANFARPHTLSTWREEGARFRWDEHDPTSVERPILVIHGDDDRLVPPDVGEALHRLAPHSELWMVPGGSHMLPMTHVGPVADRITAFARAAP